MISASSQICASLLFRKRGKFPNHLFQVNLSEDHLLALWIFKLTYPVWVRTSNIPINLPMICLGAVGFRVLDTMDFTCLSISWPFLNEPHHKRCMINNGKLKRKHGFVVSDVHPDRTTKFKKRFTPGANGRKNSSMIPRNTTAASAVAESCWKAGLGWSFLHKNQTDVIKVGDAMYYSADCGILYYMYYILLKTLPRWFLSLSSVFEAPSANLTCPTAAHRHVQEAICGDDAWLKHAPSGPPLRWEKDRGDEDTVPDWGT